MKEKLEAMLKMWRYFLREAKNSGAQEEATAWKRAIEDVEEILKSGVDES